MKYENQFVRKGDKILDLYSPDLNTYQEELLYAHKVDPDGELPKHAAHKLKLLGITDAQIQQLVKSGKASLTLSIYSAYDGYIFIHHQPKCPQRERQWPVHRVEIKWVVVWGQRPYSNSQIHLPCPQRPDRFAKEHMFQPGKHFLDQ